MKLDISAEYLGLSLKSPLVASSSPLTGTLNGMRALEDAGVGAVVLPSLLEEQIEQAGSRQAAGCSHGLEIYEAGPDHYLELVAAARAALEVPIVASLNGTSPGGWVEYAKQLEGAGADALELSVYRVAADPEATAQSIEAEYRELVERVSRRVQVPVAVKIGPFFTALAHTARELEDAGASGLVLFNRFYQPDVDLDTLEVGLRLPLSTSEELRLPLRWIAILHGRLRGSLAASTGIHTSEDALKVFLAGADVAMVASLLLAEGPRAVGRLERGILEWMEAHEYASVGQLRGSLSRRAAVDPEAFERANYVQALRSYSRPASV